MATTTIAENSEIHDIRLEPAFCGISFSKYKKTEVRAALIDNMQKGKIEPACYWAAELVAAGHYMELWEIILNYIGKYIHLGNPKIVIYLEMRYEIFRNIIAQGHHLSELDLRNNKRIRQLFAEMISVLVVSNKKHSFEAIKINRIEEFDMTQMTERLKAPSVTYAEGIFKKEDPKELYIAINEFAYNISPERRHMLTACYWIEWVIEFDQICKKRKEPVLCDKRTELHVENKMQRDIIWLIWDTLLSYTSRLANPFIEKLMNSLLNLFCIKYTTAACKRRRYLLYFAVALLTEPVPTDIEVVSKKEVIQNVLDKIDGIYCQIKKNEESPNTEYLYSNLEKRSAFNESLKKMEIMGSLDKF
jgi:hypothetical protein